ncbi:MAG: putative capsular polysaccharide synthesis family protein [Balneolaceae bacterium]|nr:putative capsular polysaccharide synthesis family protein [Balneolaceae bacterium]
MGKVGSTTVFRAFQEQHFFPLTYHVHHLTSESLKNTVERYQGKDLKIKGKVSLVNLLKGSSSHLSASFILRQAYSSESQGKWKIVTLVRDPFSTYLSHIFQNPQLTRPFLLGEDGLLDQNKVESHINDIFSRFKPEKDYISNWFEKEFLKFTGVNLYEHPFNAKKGYSIISDQGFEIAIMSLELLDRNLPIVIKKFINGSKEISVKKMNVRTKNDHADLYKNLKNKITVSREGLRKFYSTKYAKHFFTDEFRERMIERWSAD